MSKALELAKNLDWVDDTAHLNEFEISDKKADRLRLDILMVFSDVCLMSRFVQNASRMQHILLRNIWMISMELFGKVS